MTRVVVWLLIAGCAAPPSPIVGLVRERDARALEWGSGPNCGAGDRGRKLSLTRLEGNEVTVAEAQQKWDDWNAVQGLGYVIDDHEPDMAGAHSYDKWRLTYCTESSTGSPKKASALLTVPRGLSGDVTAVLYDHGTAVTRNDAPSNPNEAQVFDGPTVEVEFSPDVILVAPDGSAFQDSQITKHQYFVEAEDRHGIDAVVAALQVPEVLSATNGKLAIFGFSAGGHVALSTAKELDALCLPPTGTALVGAVAEPGPWIDTVTDFLAVEDSEYLMVYEAYLVEGYEGTFGSQVYASTSAAYKSPFGSTVPAPNGFNGTKTYADVIGIMGPRPSAMFKPVLISNMASGAFRARLDENVADDWCPSTPVQFWVSDTDDEVDPSLQLDAEAELASCGDDVSAVVKSEGRLHLEEWHADLEEIEDWILGL